MGGPSLLFLAPQGLFAGRLSDHGRQFRRALDPNRTAVMCARTPSPASRGMVTVLDYGAGNVRSLQNAIESLGFRHPLGGRAVGHRVRGPP